MPLGAYLADPSVRNLSCNFIFLYLVLELIMLVYLPSIQYLCLYCLQKKNSIWWKWDVIFDILSDLQVVSAALSEPILNCYSFMYYWDTYYDGYILGIYFYVTLGVDTLCGQIMSKSGGKMYFWKKNSKIKYNLFVIFIV